MSDSQTITHRDYWNQVESIARDVTSEARADGDDLYDRLHETIDGHEWVIYTYKAQQIIAHSQNDGAIEELGIECAITDGCLNWSAIAYCAFEADVREQLGDVEDGDQAA